MLTAVAHMLRIISRTSALIFARRSRVEGVLNALSP